MPPRNWYVILGVSPEADPDTIRSAYRALAKRHHPDRVGPGGTSRFREISEAYRILSDPVSRRAYNDQLNRQPRREYGGTESVFPWREVEAEPLVAEPVSIRRSFHTSRPSLEDDFLEWTTRHFTARHLPKSGRTNQLDLDVILSRDEAEMGGVLPIQLPAFTTCSACGGSGRDWFSLCFHCRGQGVVEGQRTVRIRIPCMVLDGTVWEVPVFEAGLSLRIRIRVETAGYY
jgi:DnaJ-class molecular chaperone